VSAEGMAASLVLLLLNSYFALDYTAPNR
jgi:hypothetical protein